MTTATLNADGSVSWYMTDPSGSLIQESLTAAQVKSVEQWYANAIATNGSAGSAPYGPQNVIIANLGIQDGLYTSAQLLDWVNKNGIEISGIFPGTPSATSPTTSESFVSALNDPALTTASNAPTLNQAVAQAAINQQQQSASSSLPGPTPLPGADINAEMVQFAYIAYYGRPADVAGQSYWVNQLKSAGSLNGIIDSFGNSAESKALYGGLNVTQQVAAIYQQEFGRSPDSTGQQYWVNQISSGKVSAAAAALAIFYGATGTDKTLINNKLVVADSYTASLAQNNGDSALYAGNTAAANARSYLSAVGTDSTVAAKIAGVSSSVAHHIQGDISGDLASVGVSMPAHTIQLIGAAQAFPEHLL